MKTNILLAAVLFHLPLSALATTSDESDRQALQILIAADPVAQSINGSARVSKLLADMMTSSFDASGNGFLSVIENTCKSKRGTSECIISINNSDRTIEPNSRSYVPTEGMTESMIQIRYRVNLQNKRIVGVPAYFFAG